MIMVSIFTAVYSSFRGREKNLCLQPLHGRDSTIDKCSKHSVYRMKIDFSVSKKITLSMKYPAGQTFDFFNKEKKIGQYFFLVGSLFLNYLIFNLIDSMTFNRS